MCQPPTCNHHGVHPYCVYERLRMVGWHHVGVECDYLVGRCMLQGCASPRMQAPAARFKVPYCHDRELSIYAA